MNVLITGATGFVGRHLIDVMCSNVNYTPVAAVRDKHANIKEQAQAVFVEDLGPTTDWQYALKDIQVVVHSAARVHILNDKTKNPLAEYRRVNLEGSLQLARQAAAASVKRFIFISSIKVNGESTKINYPFKADDVPAPIDPYGISKYETETAMLQLADETGMEVVIIRPSLVYGPGVKANFLSLMRWLDKGIPLPFGAVHNKRSYVALDNLVDLILVCIEHSAAANEIFLVSDGEDLSTTDLLKVMAAALNKPTRLVPVPTWLLYIIATMFGKRDIATRLLGSLQVDIDKTKNLLNWNPPVSLNVALKVTADDYLAKH